MSPATPTWPGGVIPYEFDPILTATQRAVYLDGLREWELAGDIQFIPRTSETNYLRLHFYHGQGTNVFMPGPPTLIVDSLSRGQVCHEMGHALGLEHEHVRTNRDSYLTVNFANMDPGASNLYVISSNSTAYGNYDFESVMHYGPRLFAVNPNADVMTPLPAYYPKYYNRMGNLALSPGDRAAAAYLYGPPAVPLTNVVTTTADSGAGSLRAALYYATDHPGTTIRFDIPGADPGHSNGVYTIHLSGYLPPLVTDGTIIDGSTQPGYAGVPLIFLDGSRIVADAYDAGTVTGLLLYAANSEVRGLAFQNFNWNGITLRHADATNNTIAGCWCGLDYTGTNTAPNTKQGILIYDTASYNIIGGSNVLSGNTEYGVLISGSNTVGNVVAGNYVGTTVSGLDGVGNGLGGVFLADGAQGNMVGGAGAAARNIISGNAGAGVWLVSVTNNTVQGNYIGLNPSGTGALANSLYGIHVSGGSRSNLATGNVLSGNGSDGIRLAGAGTVWNTVQGNFCGTDASGMSAVPNGFTGVNIQGGASSNLIGGTSVSARNVLSGNDTVGISVTDAGTEANIVRGNYIGTDVTGTNALGSFAGVYLLYSAQRNIFGGTAAGAGNVICGNYGCGFFIGSTGTSNNLIQGNSIGLAADGVTPLGNGFDGGVFLLDGASYNVIGLGLDGSGAGNVIANNDIGVRLDNATPVGNTIRGNRIHDNTYQGVELGGDVSPGVTANDVGDGDTGPNNLQNYPEITNVVSTSYSTIIKGLLSSGTNRAYLLDFYRNTNADGSGYGEGEVYLGSTTVTTGGNGTNSFSFAAAGGLAGHYITVTATDVQTGDTSEFSLAEPAVAGIDPPSFVGSLTLTETGSVAMVWLTVGQSYHIRATTNLAAPITWVTLTNFTASATNYILVDQAATNFPRRFYQVISP